MGGVGVVLAEGLARRDDLEGRLVGEHVAHLHRRGVGAQHHVVEAVQEERVLLVAGRVELGDVQLGEIVILQLDLGPDGDLIAQAEEQVLDLALDVGDQVKTSDRKIRCGQGRIRPVAAATSLAPSALFAPGQLRFDHCLELVDQLPGRRLFRGREFPELRQEMADHPFFAAKVLLSQGGQLFGRLNLRYFI